jgi:hypothetical protein
MRGRLGVNSSADFSPVLRAFESLTKTYREGIAPLAQVSESMKVFHTRVADVFSSVNRLPPDDSWAKRTSALLEAFSAMLERVDMDAYQENLESGGAEQEPGERELEPETKSVVSTDTVAASKKDRRQVVASYVSLLIMALQFIMQVYSIITSSEVEQEKSDLLKQQIAVEERLVDAGERQADSLDRLAESSGELITAIQLYFDSVPSPYAPSAISPDAEPVHTYESEVQDPDIDDPAICSR